LFVDASGNVGVGTSSVNALLEVNNSTAGGEVQRIEGNYSGSGSVTLTNWRRAGGSVAAAFKYNDDSSPLCMSIGTTTSHEFRIRTADTDAITIDASQQVGIGTTSPAVACDVVGQVRASTGILFGTDTAAANALDDYEEGTWTPNLTGSGGGAYTYGLRTGIYTKVGNTVTIHCAFEITGTTTAYSGYLYVNGLPYICKDVRAVGSMVPGSAITYSAPYTFVFPQAELNEALFYVTGGNLTSTSQLGATVSNGTMYGFSLTYKTS
jgi:hypothetical protein